MSTRCNIHFLHRGNVYANIYRHYDGYPGGVLPDLEKFFTAVEEQTAGDTRFSDPAYLAAKFVVWQAAEYADDKARPLKFTGVGVDMTDAGDGEYIYEIECGVQSENGRPVITHRKV